MVQGVTMIVGILVTLPVFWNRAGGLGEMSRNLDASHFPPLEPVGLILLPFS